MTKINFTIEYYINNAREVKHVLEERYVKPIVDVLTKLNNVKDISITDYNKNKWKAENYISQENH